LTSSLFSLSASALSWNWATASSLPTFSTLLIMHKNDPKLTDLRYQSSYYISWFCGSGIWVGFGRTIFYTGLAFEFSLYLSWPRGPRQYHSFARHIDKDGCLAGWLGWTFSLLPSMSFQTFQCGLFSWVVEFSTWQLILLEQAF
jgi:hypothetical protein